MNQTETVDSDLTEAEHARLTRNKELAEQLLSSQVIRDTSNANVVVRRPKICRTELTAGGFIPDSEPLLTDPQWFEKDEEFLDEDDVPRKRSRWRRVNHNDTTRESDAPENLCVPIPADESKPECDLCLRPFDDSFLRKNFDVFVCDRCRDPKGIHVLITKSTAKDRYLLNDVDLDVREPKLRFILKRNPHNSTWGDMRLYLEAQVAERASTIWGSEEAIEEERERRAQRMESSKLKRYKKKLKELKVQTRSSLFMKTRTNHEHDFGPETYDASEDVYVKRCTTCDFVSQFEKL